MEVSAGAAGWGWRGGSGDGRACRYLMMGPSTAKEGGESASRSLDTLTLLEFDFDGDAPQERGSDQIGSPCGPTRGSVRTSHLFSTCDEEEGSGSQKHGTRAAAAAAG